MKRCSKCNVELTISNWYPSYIKRNKYTCVHCLEKLRDPKKAAIKRKEYSLKAAQEIKNLKINGCAICGYDKCSRALHFHHTEPKNKKFQINSDTIRKRKIEDVINELNKCILFCSNCHMEIEEL